MPSIPVGGRCFAWWLLFLILLACCCCCCCCLYLILAARRRRHREQQQEESTASEDAPPLEKEDSSLLEKKDSSLGRLSSSAAAISGDCSTRSNMDMYASVVVDDEMSIAPVPPQTEPKGLDEDPRDIFDDEDALHVARQILATASVQIEAHDEQGDGILV